MPVWACFVKTRAARTQPVSQSCWFWTLARHSSVLCVKVAAATGLSQMPDNRGSKVYLFIYFAFINCCRLSVEQQKNCQQLAGLTKCQIDMSKSHQLYHQTYTEVVTMMSLLQLLHVLNTRQILNKSIFWDHVSRDLRLEKCPVFSLLMMVFREICGHSTAKDLNLTEIDFEAHKTKSSRKGSVKYGAKAKEWSWGHP